MNAFLKRSGGRLARRDTEESPVQGISGRLPVNRRQFHDDHADGLDDVGRLQFDWHRNVRCGRHDDAAARNVCGHEQLPWPIRPWPVKPLGCLSASTMSAPLDAWMWSCSPMDRRRSPGLSSPVNDRNSGFGAWHATVRDRHRSPCRESRAVARVDIRAWPAAATSRAFDGVRVLDTKERRRDFIGDGRLRPQQHRSWSSPGLLRRRVASCRHE